MSKVSEKWRVKWFNADMDSNMIRAEITKDERKIIELKEQIKELEHGINRKHRIMNMLVEKADEYEKKMNKSRKEKK